MNTFIKKIRSRLTEKPLTLWDYAIFAVLAVICYLCFVQGDIKHTAGCSVGYLNGHIFDFYDYCATFDIHPSYMPSIYILFAIWNIPMRLFGFLSVPTDQISTIATLWSKLLPCLVYVASGYLIYLISKEIGMGSKKSKLCVFACLTMPIAFYGQFIFGQYDIFMTVCVLLGLYYYLTGKDIRFVIWFGVAVTFKYTALLIFIPLLLLKIKSVAKIVGYIGLVAVPFAIEYLLYRGSETFSHYAFGIGSSGDNPTGYIFNANIFTGFELSANQYSVSLVILVFGVVCALAYFTNVKEKKEQIQYTFYLSCLVFFAIFGLAKWHPQWLLFAVPFWVISAFINKNTKIFLVLDILFMLFFTIFNVTMIPGNVDQAMMNNGILKFLFGNDIGFERSMGQIMGVIDPSMCLSFITLIILVYAWFKHPKYCVENFDAPVDDCMGWMRARLIVGVAIFVVPACMSLLASITPPDPTYSNWQADVQVSCDEAEVVQRVNAQGDVLRKVQFLVFVDDVINDGELVLFIKDGESGEVLFEKAMNTDSWYEGERITISTGEIKTPECGYYDFVFKAVPDEKEDDFRMTLGCSAKNVTGDKSEYLMIGDDKADGQLAMILYEE